MLVNYKKIIASNIFRNFFHLGLLQATNYVLPLILIPYLVRTVGEENFGKISFAQAILAYFTIIVDYGFNLSATREIAIHKEDIKKINEVFSRVLFTKLFLTLLTFLLLILLLMIFPELKSESFLYLTGFLMVVGQALLPVWFYQGIEKMQFLTYFNLISKVLSFIGVVTWIKDTKDYEKVLFFYGFAVLLAGLVGVIHVRKKFLIFLNVPSLREICEELKKGFYIFVSFFAVSLYTNTHLVILGVFTNNLVVGYYSIAEKIVYAFRVVVIIFNQSVFPYLYSIAYQFDKLVRFFGRIYTVFLFSFLLITFIAYFYTEPIVYFVSNNPSSPSNEILQLIIFIPFITILHLPTGGVLLVHQKDKAYSKAIVITSLASILLNVPAAYYYQAQGVGWVSVFLEIFILLVFLIILKRNYPELYIVDKILIKNSL